MNQNRIYLDYAATAPLRQEAEEAISSLLEQNFGNPSSIHQPGRSARNLIDRAREQTAKLFGAKPEQIIFTSSGTESNVLTLEGSFSKPSGKLITSAIEHPSVFEAAQKLRNKGVEVEFLRVDKKGIIDTEQLREALTPDTKLVSIMHVNNEVGSVQPVVEVSKMIDEFNQQNDSSIKLHTDAVQSVPYLNIHKDHLQADLISVSGHKLGGLSGAGVLFVSDLSTLSPVIVGGEQEHGLRAGTENTGGIISLGAAAEMTHTDKQSEKARVSELKQKLEEILNTISKLEINTPEESAPHILNFSVDGIDAQELVIAADRKGLSVSSGSACSSGRVEPSRTIEEMGVADPESAVRLSLGWDTKESEITEAGERLKDIINQLS